MNAVIAMLTIGTATLPAAGLELQNTGNLAVRWNAESLVSGETLRQGKVSLMSEDDQEKTITDNAGWRVCNRWNDKAFLLLPDCDGANAECAFDSYGHGAMTVDFSLAETGAVDEAIKEMKGWVTVL